MYNDEFTLNPVVRLIIKIPTPSKLYSTHFTVTIVALINSTAVLHRYFQIMFAGNHPLDKVTGWRL